VSWAAPAVGLAIAGLWLLTATPAPAPEVAEAESAVWLVFRVIGSVLLVPVCEELMFRGYLLRRLQAADFSSISAKAWTPFALVASSVVFGVLHDRWIAATVAGLAYAVLSVRTGRLSEAIVAHAVTNGCIAAWVLGTGDWSHWL
jgi:CAAX prenyl protease-like protein